MISEWTKSSKANNEYDDKEVKKYQGNKTKTWQETKMIS
jgi:hypothetical protein